MQRTLWSALVSSTALLLAAPAVQAGQVSYSTTAGPLAIGGSATVTLPQYDGSLGVLRNARVTVAARVSGTLGYENLNASPQVIDMGAWYGTIVPVQLPSGFAPGPNPAFVPPWPSTQLAAYDGTTDFGGTSGVTFAFVDTYGDGNPNPTFDLYMDAALAAYVGAGSVSIGLGPVLEQSGQVPPNVARSASVVTDVIITVQYLYDAFPTPICRTAWWSGCPCGNSSMLAHGCGNSANPAGGELTAAGTASLSSDTLTLAGSGMTPSSTALYFQGTSMQYAQIVYGDGLRCVTGTVVRLGTKTNASGASSYPQAGDLPVSVRGQVTAPGLRYYQVVYRDVGNYCTPDLFNATSGVAILWSL